MMEETAEPAYRKEVLQMIVALEYIASLIPMNIYSEGMNIHKVVFGLKVLNFKGCNNFSTFSCDPEVQINCVCVVDST